MRALLALVVGMGVLIVVGVAVVAVTIMHRMAAPAGVAAVPALAATLAEPAGTHIFAVSTVGDRLAVVLQGGGADRVVFVDRTGAVTGRLTLRP